MTKDSCFECTARRLTTVAALGLVMTAQAVPTGAMAKSPAVRQPQTLQFQVTEGRNLNAFFRQGPVAAHLLLRNGNDPRVLVAFPAGNSGVGLWFDHMGQPVAWRIVSAPVPRNHTDPAGRPLYGIAATVEATAPRLTVKQAILSSVRVLRDYQSDGLVAREVASEPVIAGQTITWARNRLDGAPGYRLALTVTHGTLDHGAMVAGADGRLVLTIEAQSGETPLTTLDGQALLSDAANPDVNARNTLRFLSYREKFLAGSWRFDTYFGRDTMMSVGLLMPALQTTAIESGIRSVVARLSPEGEAAHEEGIGEFAVIDHLRHHDGEGAAPEYDYGMIDSTYMLAPLVARYLVDDRRGIDRAARFLATPSGREGGSAETTGAALMRNLRLVLRQTQPFADRPGSATLLAIKPGRTTGEWRDSNDGLGLGRYPYDVNAVLAPAALHAIARLHAAGLLDRYMAPGDKELLARAAPMAKVWQEQAPGLFDVVVPAAAAHAAIADYAQKLGVPAAPAQGAVPDGGLAFHALSLDQSGAPVRVVNSDEGFALMFGDPPPDLLDRAVAALMRPFPAGLMTDVGMLVANPVYGTQADRARFTRNAYHGLVVWSWQQALFAAGLDRQLQRTDLPAGIRARLVAARRALWQAIEAHKDMESSELWSWAFEQGHYTVVPFGAGAGDADESNAAQLWSSAYLALKPPVPGR
jgi:hypothetical protein